MGKELTVAAVLALAKAWDGMIDELRGQNPPDRVVAMHEAVCTIMDQAGIQPIARVSS